MVQLGAVHNKIIRFLNGLSSVLVLVVGAWVIIDVVGRIFFNYPLTGTPEVAAFSIVAIAFLQMPNVLLEDAHIRSTLILSKLRPVGREWIEIFSGVLGIALFVAAIIGSWKQTLESWVTWEYVGEGSLHVPVYPIRTIILIGCVLMTIHFGIRITASINRLCQRKETSA